MSSVLDSRSRLAPFADQYVRCRGVLMRDDTAGRATTLVSRVEADLGGDGGWLPVGRHAWVGGRRLCRDWGVGVLVEFTAVVRRYTTGNPMGGDRVERWGLEQVRGVKVVGPADLAAAVADLVAAWGWERVADMVAAQYGEAEQ